MIIKLQIKTLLLFALSMLFFGCSEEAKGPIEGQEITTDSFEGVELKVAGNVEIVYGEQQSVRVEAQQNVLDNLTTNVRNNVMEIDLSKSMSNYTLNVYITTPLLNVANVSGSGTIKFENPKSENLSIALSGSGSIEGKNLETVSRVINIATSGSGKIVLSEIQTSSITTMLSGSGSIELSGSTVSIIDQKSGSGNLEGFNLTTENANITISGSGNTSITCTTKLDVGIAGSGSVFYKGTPEVNAAISGSGRVESAN
ncbi:head GIN domain-containing protein [Flammeovirga kamogawensis]|uniref:DUF2807 domain-containing protein n=1 Tax=Flammeovirga kamogawensis TaxID=373891 RepID=A0ABX8GZ15_9BACT|nr:head GIN domain-containing protein [Flammeovirga kamogawensis]MBB6459222.1 carbon monoxide dehydrogenase subunit G [Flammeovirga kamogawensis]QWG08786.1 DUF2807 domain-containing protein [Flammeovirga kamogawensis]TRX67076.1 DUF2807 domain-containing protein [Flammeovirga kamogawensis]